ncbi:SPOR domain-containing protein [Streptomyces sp. NPDC017405]|uniref:SPOR domain-containing protein n=1 Tax=unclassified Streptomyces TaxID=2593676 RepID=UPI0037B4D680
MSEGNVDGPFPMPVSREDQEAWIKAVLATEGVNLPRGALENIAPFIVDPDDMLSEPDAHGVRTLKASAVRRIRTGAGDMVVAVVRMHGVGGVQWGHNERISSIWRSVADPTVGRETERTLASVRPWMGVDDDGRKKGFAALESVVVNRRTLIMNAEDAADELKRRDRVRPYDLEEDLVLNGQQDPGMYVAQQVRIEESPEKDSDGNPLYPSAYWGWMAVRGNNRTQKRQSIFRLTSGEVLAGVPAEKLEREGDEVICDPRDWLPEFSAVLNREFAETGDGELDPASSSRAQRAAAIAVVDAHLVIGTPTPQRLYRIVQMNNRRDHVHPPLEFDALDRSRALGRSVLGMYVAQQVMDEKTAEVLSGLAPIRELPGASSDMTVSELRDLRSMRLMQELFPVDPRKRHLLRRALSENPPSQLKSGEINQRARTWSALTSESYPKPWNPRVGEVFSTRAREGIILSGRRLPDLLAAADTDDDAFDELVSYRAAHWLASFGIIEADRGSLDSQEAIGDAGERIRRSRRTVMNCLQALRYEKSRMMAVGVLRSLAAAMDDGDRRPWRVSSSGKEMVGREMTPLWFDSEFPKDTGTRPRKTANSAPPLLTTVPAPNLLASPRLPAQSSVAPTPSPVTPAAAQPLAPRPAPAVSAQPEAPATDEADGSDSSVPSPKTPLTLETLVARVEERVRGLHTASAEIGELLGHLADQSQAASVVHPIGRQQADRTVRLLNQTLSRLRRLPELMEEMTEPV